ncbi:MAG: inositol monophosphatase family protein [Candidatus Thorarchaeota archaeon]
MKNDTDLLSILKTIVLSGGLVLKAFRGRVENIPKESDLPPEKVQKSSVAHTAVDDLVQEVALEILSSHLPDVAINVEEDTPRSKLFSQDKTDLCFHLDPLDGTLAYLQGSDGFTIGAAFSQNLEFEVSAIYFPARDQLFLGERGKGAKMQANLGKERTIGRSEHASNTYVQKRCDSFLPIIKKMRLKPFNSMSAHNTMIAIARGEVRLQMYHMASPHDFGIPQVVVEELGGICTDLEGNSIKYGPKFDRIPYFLTFYDPETKDEFFEELNREKSETKQLH